MNRKKMLISLAMAMLSMAGLAADNLPALRVQGKNGSPVKVCGLGIDLH